MSSHSAHLPALKHPPTAWETVDLEWVTDFPVCQTDRLRVPGGWLYRTTITDPSSDHTTVAMAFVPEDPQPAEPNAPHPF